MTTDKATRSRGNKPPAGISDTRLDEEIRQRLAGRERTIAELRGELDCPEVLFRAALDRLQEQNQIEVTQQWAQVRIRLAANGGDRSW